LQIALKTGELEVVAPIAGSPQPKKPNSIARSHRANKWHFDSRNYHEAAARMRGAIGSRVL